MWKRVVGYILAVLQIAAVLAAITYLIFRFS